MSSMMKKQLTEQLSKDKKLVELKAQQISTDADFGAEFDNFSDDVKAALRQYQRGEFVPFDPENH